MPWELTMRRADGSPLGRRASVKLLMKLVCPALRYVRQPSGAEQIAAARTAGVEFPDILSKHLQQRPATETADFEGEGFSVRFFLGPDGELTTLDAEVRGDTQRAMPYLEKLAAQMHWVVAEIGRIEPLIQ